MTSSIGEEIAHALVAALKLATDAMCAATFVKGVDKRDLNHAIDKARAALALVEEKPPASVEPEGY